ncbi:hypothetical protein [Streptomyces tendae]|uniref:hypothetical protein n=1 Tax=Streptomyces tendae TaxID=1932 RepID=UPI00365EABA2
MEVGGLARPLSTPPDRKVLRRCSDLADVLLIGATTAMVEASAVSAPTGRPSTADAGTAWPTSRRRPS